MRADLALSGVASRERAGAGGGKGVSVGGQIGIAEGRLADAQGKLYMFAMTTRLIFPV